MMGRPILYRQVGYRFYRPAAFAVAAVTADVPYNAANIFIFSIILYFMGGLYSSGGAFFTFYLFVFTTFMVMAGFFVSFSGAAEFELTNSVLLVWPLPTTTSQLVLPRC